MGRWRSSPAASGRRPLHLLINQLTARVWPALRKTLQRSEESFLRKTPVEGAAATSVWCATRSILDGMEGVYCEDCDIGEPVPADSKEARGVTAWIMDQDLAKRRWTESEEWSK